jgi:hypothetical protein
VFQKELYSGFPNVTLWRVLGKRLYLKAYKLYIVQVFERWTVYKPLKVKVLLQRGMYSCNSIKTTAPGEQAGLSWHKINNSKLKINSRLFRVFP